jgi:hydrogenase expression/formation protein HypE
MQPTTQQLTSVLEKIERVRQVRRRKFYLRDEHVTLSHGSGGKASHNLIEGLFAPAFSNPMLEMMDDAATFRLNGGAGIAMTTDSFVVNPLFFPGGNIGQLAVHGTVNDLAMSGAKPLFLSAAFILEEGFAIAELKHIVQAMAQAALQAGVQIVTGDTKVVERGKADGIFINTTGVGVLQADWPISQMQARPGDRILVSGPVGDHGIAVMLAREALEMETTVQSDTAALHELVADVLEAAGEGVHCLKDPTRGGLATSLNEIALGSEVAVALDERLIPVRPEVRGACEILGLDPLTIANEGKLLAVVSPEATAPALRAMKAHPLGHEAAVIGEVRPEPAAMVFLRTQLGGTRVLDMLVGDPLPRIC